MEYSKIIEKIQVYFPKVRNSVSAPIYIQTHKMITKDQTKFYPECIYCGYASDLGSPLDDSEISNIICILDEPVPEEYLKSSNVNLTTVPWGFDPVILMNTISDIMIDESRLAAYMRRLLDALYANNGLQYLVDTASELFGNPLFINDSAYKILSFSKGFNFGVDTLDDEKVTGYVHETNIKEMRKDRIFDRLEQSKGPFYSKNPRINKGFLFTPIKIKKITVGCIALIENNKSFTPLDYELMTRFAQLVAIEMEKSDFYRSSKGVMYGFLLTDLISEKLKSINVIERRFALLQWKTYKYCKFFVLQAKTSDDPIQELQRIGDEFRRILPDTRWTVKDQNLVVFLSRATKHLLTESERGMLKTFLQSNRLSIGVSDPMTDLTKASKYYKQALTALELGINSGKYREIYYYEELVIDHMAKIIAEKHILQDFYHPGFILLKQYDKKNNTELVETLKAYLHYPNEPATVAELLCIHRNTLLYRINKIKEITGLTLSDGDDILKLMLSVKFEEYQNR